MRTIEELKKEQYEAKAKLHELIELINSEEFYTFSATEKGLIGQQRTALEMYVSSLTKQLYGKDETPDASNLVWLSMLYGMVNTPSGFGNTSGTYKLKETLEEKDFDVKPETDEPGHDN
jgi:hypothetical protein